jgi:hypothetical protein
MGAREGERSPVRDEYYRAVAGEELKPPSPLHINIQRIKLKMALEVITWTKWVLEC